MFDFSAFFAQYGNLFLQGTVDTLIMTCVATILAYVIGIPLGILLVVTSPNGLRPNRIVSTIVGWIVNIGRSVPFIILLVALIPFTRFIGNFARRAGSRRAPCGDSCALRRANGRAEP